MLGCEAGPLSVVLDCEVWAKLCDEVLGFEVRWGTFRCAASARAARPTGE